MSSKYEIRPIIMSIFSKECRRVFIFFHSKQKFKLVILYRIQIRNHV